MDPRFSIRARLRKVILMTTGIVLLVTSLSFIINELVSFRRAYRDIISTLAEVVAESSTASLAFQDQADAVRALSALRVEPQILRAALYDNSGTLFASYPEQEPITAFPAAVPEVQQRYRAGSLTVVRPVVQKTRLGTLYLQASLAPLYDRLQFYSLVAVGVMAGSFVIALLLSAYLQGQISEPILALSRTAQSITTDRDYRLRARKTTEDEIGTLTESFNDMLEQIENRDAALLKSAERLHLALEGSQAGTWDWDLVTNKLVWDEYSYRLFGLKPGQFELTYENYLNLIHPDDRPEVERAIKRAIDQRRELTLEARAIWPDQSIHYIASRGKPFFDSTGRPVRMAGMTIDVSDAKRTEQALRESEERFRAMADAAPVLIWTSNTHGRIDYLNRAWLEFTGRTLEQELGLGWLDLVVEEDRTRVKAAWEKAFQERSPLQIDYRMRRRDGQARWLLDHGVPRFAPDGTFQGFIGTCLDITERKLAQSELERRVQMRTAELAESNRELEAFTYSVSHDLRAPLRHINAYAQIVREEYARTLPQDGQTYLQRIQEGATNMGRLVDDLLNLARVGRADLAMELCDLNPIVQSIAQELTEDNAARKIEWRIGRLSPAVCDPGLIRQVFINLLSNAVKYSRTRELATIECYETIENGERTIAIKDNGVGFSMKYKDKLFGVFQRLHRAEDFEGTGVGLAIVERVIRKHGGRIWAEAELDKGASFYFTLPLTKESQGRS